MTTLNRKTQAKTYANFYKPKERIEVRRRSDATIVICIAVIVIVALVRGL
jgi:hypothetical protein